MQIWVDADACPNVIKNILYKAARREKVIVTLVANNPLKVPTSRYIKFIQVPDGFDAADKEIIKMVEPGDLVITADIPLATEVIAKGAYALDPRGEFYSEANVKARLNIRDFMDTLRAGGINTGGPAPLSQNNKQAFANELGRFLVKFNQ